MKIVVSSIKPVHFFGSHAPGIRSGEQKFPIEKATRIHNFHTRNLRARNGQLRATIWQIM